MRARATGNFTRDELSKAGSVTELPKNYTDYQDADGADDEDDKESTGGGGELPPGSGGF